MGHLSNRWFEAFRCAEGQKMLEVAICFSLDQGYKSVHEFLLANWMMSAPTPPRGAINRAPTHWPSLRSAKGGIPRARVNVVKTHHRAGMHLHLTLIGWGISCPEVGHPGGIGTS